MQNNLKTMREKRKSDKIQDAKTFIDFALKLNPFQVSVKGITIARSENLP